MTALPRLAKEVPPSAYDPKKGMNQMGKTLIVFKITCQEMDQLDTTMDAIHRIQKGEVKDVQKIPIVSKITDAIFPDSSTPKSDNASAIVPIV